MSSPSSLSSSSPLVSSCEHLLKPNGCVVGREVAQAILPIFPSMSSAIPKDHMTPRAALRSTDRRNPITHGRIHEFINQEVGPLLHKMSIGRSNRVALVLPNGPELALAILAVSNWACCVPLNAFGARSEVEADLKASGASLVIGMVDPAHGGGGQGELDSIPVIARKVGIPFCGLVPSQMEAGIFRLLPPETSSISVPALKMTGLLDESSRFQPNQHEDEVLVLFTSGTTGQKKLVPHLLGDVLVATATICMSWKLSPTDVNCNLMPLFHVGGIIRQVFSPVLSGGCVICCTSFDPSHFWSLLVNQQAFTWYYAAPTMHQLILETGKRKGFIHKKGSTSPKAHTFKLKMIANAAGGLLPSLARELRQVFQANVLPSYGMTECMPITSPPANYQLEKPGTSGVAVGPEVAILNRETGRQLPVATEGPICVRGAPCFRGYGVDYNKPNAEKPVSCFLQGGWFDTGDLGYMDSDGYLYITGRSKEVINRGGEIISPLEVEEAVLSHPDVQACVAFSAAHDVLQEVVGIVVVPVVGRPKVDLHSLHDHLGQGLLTALKWPQCLVYIDALPKSNTNKLLRVKLGQRMRVPELNDNMLPIERTYTAKCPPQGTPITVAIPCDRVSVQPKVVETILREEFKVLHGGQQDLKVVPHAHRIGSLVAHVYNIDRLHLIRTAKEKLDAYLVPSHVCLMDKPGMTEADLTILTPEPSDAIGSILAEESRASRGPADPLVTELQELYRDLLDLDCVPDPDTNFFNLGGSSMLASQLASRIRKNFRVAFGGAEVFHHSNCTAMAFLIRDRLGQTPPGSTSSIPSESAPTSSSASSLYQDRNVETHGAPFISNRLNPNTSFFTYLFQLLPLCIVNPLYSLTRFFCFFMCLLLVLKRVPAEGNFLKFVATVFIFHLLWVIVTPLVFIALKWIIIGRYKEGRYPIWGHYYLRWWFVEILRKLFGKGMWGSNAVLLNGYYRMLGAKIGKDARISSQAEVAEYDLVSIGEGAGIEYSTVRGFGVDNGCMILGPVKVGNHASVGISSVVAPFTAVADGVHMGPCTSSYEIGSSNHDHAKYNRRCLPEPGMLMQIFVGGPITFIVDTIGHIPATLVLYWMITMPWHHGEPFETVTDLMEWLCDVRRIPFYIGIRVARAVVDPLFYMGAAIMVKWIVIGKFEPGPRDTNSQWQLLRHWLADTLFSRENLQDVTEIVGRHYGLVSVLYRLLGAKVGERVFWPGHLPIFSGEFDLLEVGDDVVFGSRATILCTTIDSAEKVVLCAGANVSDNTVVCPGGVIGKNAVLGSNTVCPRGRYLPESSVWLGSRSGNPVRLERGTEPDIEDVMLSSEIKMEKLQFTGDKTTLRPFGKGYYKREANYFVYPLPFIILFTIACKILVAIVHTIPLLGALHLAAGYFFGFPISERDYNSDRYSQGPGQLYLVLFVFMMFTNLISVSLWLVIELSAKWGFMGQRQEGRYNYDTCNYGQNWELYQIVSHVRNNGRMNLMDFIAGTPYMSTFFRLNGCKIGAECCLYPAGGDPYMPEPDLVFIGDRCVVDKASIVAHLNTRGNFELTKIIVGNHVTLRSRSRIQQGVHMESGSMILEKSLAMTGEIIEADSVWQGAPASLLFMYDSVSVVYGLEEAANAVVVGGTTEVPLPYEFIRHDDACSC